MVQLSTSILLVALLATFNVGALPVDADSLVVGSLFRFLQQPAMLITP
jgi:hypothetical protein